MDKREFLKISALTAASLFLGVSPETSAKEAIAKSAKSLSLPPNFSLSDCYYAPPVDLVLDPPMFYNGGNQLVLPGLKGEYDNVQSLLWIINDGKPHVENGIWQKQGFTWEKNYTNHVKIQDQWLLYKGAFWVWQENKEESSGSGVWLEAPGLIVCGPRSYEKFSVPYLIWPDPETSLLCVARIASDLETKTS